MRTTVNLEPDVLAEVERIRKERSLGLSEAVNELARQGMKGKQPRKQFTQRVQSLGLKIDVTNVAEALEVLEGPAHR